MSGSALVYGPVPSRRLGRSLGINNFESKVCDYSCVYCQAGRTTRMETNRRAFASPDRVLAEAGDRIRELRRDGEFLDYLTFVSDGEPTLDSNLGLEIDRLKTYGIDVAVITNSSLIGRKDVRDDLALADWVSLKFDAIDSDLWRRVNAPHSSLDLTGIKSGARRFARDYSGTLTTETMLVRGINDSEQSVRAVAGFLSTLSPEVAYLSVPTRPPARSWVQPPDEEVLARAFSVFDRALPRVELLIGYEGDSFSSTGNLEQDLLSITAVHPMRENAVDELVSRTGSKWSVVSSLVNDERLITTEYRGERYYLRALQRSQRRR
jgi:wyosine [tRNA(Phe)-imidazoG37] synthetase (radical SAM superfamily)